MVNAGYYGDYYIWYFLSVMGSALVYLSLAITVATIVATWRIYDKAGEHGWASLIPIYAQYVLYRITWGNGWLFLLLLVPVVNVIVGIITLVKLAKSFGYGGGFACGLIFLNTIFMLILGFGSSRYMGPGGSGGWDGRGDGGYGRYGRGDGYGQSGGYDSGYGGYSRGGGDSGCDEGRGGGDDDGAGSYDYGYTRQEFTRCPECGASISGSAKFCPYCGGKLR